MNKAIVVRLEAVPLNEDVESSHGVSQTSLEILPSPVSDMFEMTDRRQHGQDCLDDHAHIPGTTFADFHVFRIALFGKEAMVNEDNHAVQGFLKVE